MARWLLCVVAVGASFIGGRMSLPSDQDWFGFSLSERHPDSLEAAFRRDLAYVLSADSADALFRRWAALAPSFGVRYPERDTKSWGGWHIGNGYWLHGASLDAAEWHIVNPALKQGSSEPVAKDPEGLRLAKAGPPSLWFITPSGVQSAVPSAEVLPECVVLLSSGPQLVALSLGDGTCVGVPLRLPR